ncbi:MAG TPA: hypothetical protein VMS60_07800 [Solirubrobacterales bacterium]|nr:hypothetical protein [Solirubrobacterales bacterium]
MAVLTCAPTALGAGIQVTGGETQLRLSPGLEKALGKDGVTIQPLAPARLKGRNLILPVAAGAFDADADTDTLAHIGGLKLASGKRSVSLRRLSFDASTKSLSATVAGKRIHIARLVGGSLERDGFDARLKVKRMPLTGTAAATLNKVLELPKILRAGRSLGSASGLGEASVVDIDFGKIAIGGPETVFSKLEALKVQMGLWGGSERWAAPGENYFLFDIAPTTVTRDASAGILDTQENDGISMQIHESPPREMLLRHPRIDLTTRELGATLTPLSKENPVTGTIATLDYTTATIQIRPKVGAFELMGIRAISTQFIADQLNTRFATPGLFQPGETLARMTITLHAR